MNDTNATLYAFFQISRGHADPRKQNTTNVKNHLDRKHSKELKEMAAQEPSAVPSNEPTINAGREARKRGSANYTELFALCPQKRRRELFQSTINDWVEAKTMLHSGSARAQRLHKGIFEMLIMDNQPFYEVMKPGFLRAWNIAVPNFRVASDKYYRSMLEPTYDSIR